jgi:hypothetical protein
LALTIAESFHSRAQVAVRCGLSYGFFLFCSFFSPAYAKASVGTRDEVPGSTRTIAVLRR